MTNDSIAPKEAIAVYTPQQIEEVAIMLECSSSTENYRDRLADFVFQHDSGAWWTCDPQTQTWHRNVQGKWTVSHSPGGRLLGPAWVGQLYSFGQDDDLVDDESPDLPQDPSSTDTPQELAMAIANIQDKFAAGEYDSSVAETLLRNFYLLDSHWQIWTVGVRSGQWFMLNKQGWVESPGEPSDLASSEAPDFSQRAIEAQIPMLAGNVAELPESIIPTWQPPNGLDQPISGETNEDFLRCRKCNATLSHQAKFCSACGTELQNHRQPQQVKSTQPSPPQPVEKPREEPQIEFISNPQPKVRSKPPGQTKTSRLGKYILGVVIALISMVLVVLLAVWLDDQVFVSPETMYWRGENYRSGEQVPRNPEEALYWLKRAEKKGHTGAMFSLGNMYESGDGVERDLTKARKYFNEASNAGHREAMLMLARMYERGEGGPVDIDKAYELRVKATN